MKVSIALCTYNGSKYLKKQLDSLKKQTIKADEIVVCDDVSTDTTIEIIKRYENILNIKLFVNEKSLGVTKNFEKAISLCCGDIIFLCDQDDIWEENKVEIMLKSFEQDNNIGICLCNGKLIDENSKQIKNYTLWKAFEIDKINKQNFNAYSLINKYVFTGMATAFRSSLRDYILPISKNSLHDEWIGLIGTYFSKVFFVEDCLLKYRIHGKQQVGINSILSLKEIYVLLQKYTFSDICRELRKVKDLINRFEKFDADEKFINKLRKKEQFFLIRTTKSKFRFFLLFWNLIIGKYKKYTNGGYKTFFRDIFVRK